MTTEERVGRIMTVRHVGNEVLHLRLDRGVVRVGDLLHLHGPNVDLEERIARLMVGHREVDEVREGEEFDVELAIVLPYETDVYLVRDEEGDALDDVMRDYPALRRIPPSPPSIRKRRGETVSA